MAHACVNPFLSFLEGAPFEARRGADDSFYLALAQADAQWKEMLLTPEQQRSYGGRRSGVATSEQVAHAAYVDRLLAALFSRPGPVRKFNRVVGHTNRGRASIRASMMEARLVPLSSLPDDENVRLTIALRRERRGGRHGRVVRFPRMAEVVPLDTRRRERAKVAA